MQFCITEIENDCESTALKNRNEWTVKIGEDPGVHYQGTLPSPILTVQALL